MALKSKIAAFRAGLSQAIDEAVDATADLGVARAQSLVAVDTGALRASIEKFGAGGSGTRTVEAGQSLDYAASQEYGGVAPAHPFMTPAAQDMTQALPKSVIAKINALAGKSKV